MDRKLDAACGLTDNWLLQTCAEALEGSVDPNDQTDWAVLRDRKLSWFSTSVGAVQVESICSLIEQIVFLDKLYVMEGWTAAWQRKSSQLAALSKQKMLVTFDPAEKLAEEYRQYYIDSFCKDRAVAREHKAAERAWSKGEKRFAGQLIGGSTGYLAQSSLKGISYVPHPLRARFLKSTIYADPAPGDPQRVLKKLINETRTKLVARVGEENIVTTLSCRLPSIALLCLRESSKTSPLLSAFQLRNDFRKLRESMREVKAAIALDPVDGTMKLTGLMKEFEHAIREVERRLKLRELDERDGFAQITVFKGLTFKVPDKLRAPIIPPRHTTAMHRLVTTALYDLPQVLKSSLGMGSPTIVRDLIDFSQDKGKPLLR